MTCIYSHEDGAYCDKHSHGPVTLSCSGEENCPDRKVLTNADRIRNMTATDEGLARFINFTTCCANCPAKRSCPENYATPDKCVSSLLSWLKQEGET